MLFGVAALAAGASAFSAGATQSLKSIRAQEAEEASLGREAAYTNSVCGADIAAEIDWNSTSGWPADADLVDACDGALGAIEAACRSGAKDDLSSLSTFVCAGDGSGPDLDGDVFRFGASPGVSGFGETRDYLDGAF